MFSLTFRSPAALHKFRFSIGRKKKVDDRNLYPFVMKVDEKSGRMGNHTEGAWKTFFVLVCRRFNQRSLSNRLQSREPSHIARPRITK